MCMLTGGNIDLSCGSFVCFLGAIGGILMTVKQINPGVSIIVMLIVGLVYGSLLGYIIAYVNIPPWIATLAGYLAFRGWGFCQQHDRKYLACGTEGFPCDLFRQGVLYSC